MRVVLGFIGLLIFCAVVLLMVVAYILTWFLSRPLLLWGWRVLVTSEEVAEVLSDHGWRSTTDVVKEIRAERLKRQPFALLLFETEVFIQLQWAVKRGTAEVRTGEEGPCPQCGGRHPCFQFRQKGQRFPRRKQKWIPDFLDLHRPVWA